MPPTVTCTNCGSVFRLPDPTTGQPARCPSCFTPFQVPPRPTSSATSPGPFAPPAPGPNKTVLAEPEVMIRYTCPKCRKALESPASFAGSKLNCPACNQRLQIPQPPPPPAPAAPPLNKTILAFGEPAPGAGNQPAPSSLPPPTFEVPLDEVELVEQPPVVAPVPASTRESCLECGMDVSKRSRVQTCPDCGSLFCSAQCYREHRYHAHDKRKKKRARDVECEYCGSTARPYVTTQISEGGWVIFVVLLILFFPLCWIGLLMNETRVKCFDCGRRLD